MTIGKSIEKCRKHKKLKRGELAKKSGIPYQTIYYWENDWTTPRVDLLICIADVLGITLDELVGRSV